MDGQRDNGESVIMDGCAPARMRMHVLVSPPSLAPA